MVLIIIPAVVIIIMVSLSVIRQGVPWSGLFIYNQTYHPTVGDLVRVTGTVNEYYGLTEISSVTSCQVLSQGNPLPAPSEINTGSLDNFSSGEQWEGVLVKVLNVSVTVGTQYLSRVLY